MEYGLRLSTDQKLPSDPREMCGAKWRDLLPEGFLRSLYFGSEFCQDLLPAVKKAKQYCTMAMEAGLEAVLLTPVATPFGVDRVGRLLSELAESGLAPSVVFNDWGVHEMLRRYHPALRLRAGRLLNRGLRDPRLAEKLSPPSILRSGRAQRLRALLERYQVDAIETDSDLEGGYLGDGREGLQRVLHLPYSFVATGRNCLLKAETAGETGFTKALGRVCPAGCLDRCHSVNREDTQVPLWRAGNTLFFEVPDVWAKFHLAHTDRIVLHERPLA